MRKGNKMNRSVNHPTWFLKFATHIKSIIFLIILMVFLFACQKPVEVKPLSCLVETAPLSFTEDSLQVLYRLHVSGEAEASYFYYLTDEGKVSINAPDTLVEVILHLKEPKIIQAGAGGKATNGYIRVECIGTTSDGKSYEAMDQCFQNVIQEAS